MIYVYKCRNSNCEGTKEHDQPMKDPLPKRLKCPICGKMSLRHVIDFPDAVIIPDGFNTSNNKINYNKSPSRGKHFW